MEREIEREVKLDPPAGFVLPELGGERLPVRSFVSTYHDTDDLRLASWNVTLRHRVENGAGTWQLKLPHGEARIELALPGPPGYAPGEMLRLLPAFLRGAELAPVARLRTRRQTTHVDGADVVLDAVAVLEAQRVVREFSEVEVELVDGDEATLRALSRALRRAGATAPASFAPKLYRALGLTWEPTSTERPATPAEELTVALREQYVALVSHDPGTRLGHDPEDLHQLRVATRRLRAYLRAARPLVERSWAEGLRDELGWLGSALGPARDLDVLCDDLRAELAALDGDGASLEPLVAELERERASARADVVAAMSTSRYLTLLDRLEAVDPPIVDPKTTLAEIWWSQFRRLRKAVKQLDEEPADDALHAIRIDVKRARYAADLAAVELGKRGAGFIGAAKVMQDILGAHQDAHVAEERVRGWVDSHPAAAFAAGRFVERQHAKRRTARRDWPGAWRDVKLAAKKARP